MRTSCRSRALPAPHGRARLAVPRCGEGGDGAIAGRVDARLPRRAKRRQHPWPRRLLGITCAAAAVFALRALAAGLPAIAPVAHQPTTPRRPLQANAALTAIDRLPLLPRGSVARQWSSVDPAERNQDGLPTSIVYRNSQGQSVIFAASGPGVVENLWVAGSLRKMGNIVVRLDGHHRPVVDEPATTFFSGQAAPFLFPLTGNAARSSGGNYSFVPIAFQTACSIAFTGTTAFWHVDFRRLPPGTRVIPFSPGTNLRPVATAWSNAGRNPHRATGSRSHSGTVRLPANGSVTLARIPGPAQLDTLRLTLPSAAVGQPVTATYSGVGFTGSANFVLRLPPGATAARLTGRFDVAIRNVQAAVWVDGVRIGTFGNGGYTYGPYRWRRRRLTVPAQLVRGHRTLHVRLTDSADPAAVRIYGVRISDRSASGAWQRGDQLAFTPSSEQNHAFSATGLDWHGQTTAAYAPAALSRSSRVLNDTWLQITFDGQTRPAVNAPLGLFFGSGFGAWRVRALLMGIHPSTGGLYSFWPMPFARQAVVRLRHQGTSSLTVRYALGDRPSATVGRRLATGSEGYFHASYSAQTPTVAGQDFPALQAQGTGRLVGISMAMTTPPGMPYGRTNLQGNDQFYLDGSATPAYLGTGTEDFFGGGWYFQYGPFSLPVQGSPAQTLGPGGRGETSAYRLFLADNIPFYRSLRAGFQVGPTGTLQADYAAVAYWYGRSRPSLLPGDILDVGSAASAKAHDLHTAGLRWTGSLTSVYQGQFNHVTLGDRGTTSTGATSFRLRINPANQGVVLRRRFDQCVAPERAQVYVDGHAAGTWYNPQRNCIERWRDSSFRLPAALTAGRSQIAVRIVPQSGRAWSAFRYQAWIFRPAAGSAP